MIRAYIFFTLAIMISACSHKELSYYEPIECDCESKDNNKFISKGNNYKFASGDYQSDEKKHSGKFSVKTTPNNPYALEHILTNVKEGDFYKISVWSFSEDKKNSINVTCGNPISFSVSCSSPTMISSDGWDLLLVEFTIPANVDGKDLKVFAWNKSSQISYFDDLIISKYPVIGDYGIEDTCLEINIDSINFSKLSSIREEAIKTGIIIKDDSSWFKAEMKYGTKNYKIDIRFKGDWANHLSTNKWSFRIKVKKNKSWNGFRTFSIHSPEARNYIDEWAVHKFYEKEDVLTTRYGFVPVKINGKSMGVYAYEEHFEKQLLESKSRREGPILKFLEDLMWIVTKENLVTNNLYSNISYFNASTIVPFKVSYVLSNDNLHNQFLIAQNLLYQHKYQLVNTSEVFEIDKLAKYYALADIFKLSHGCFTWHNQRFYYNPVLSKLEPIMFDGYADSNTKSWMLLPLIASYYYQYNNLIKDYKMRLNLHPLSDSKFRSLYIKYINAFSDSLYIDSMFNVINDDYTKYLTLLKKEYPYYDFDKQHIYTSAKIIRDSINNFIKSDIYYNTCMQSEFPEINTSNNLLPENFGFIPYFVRIFIQNHTKDVYSIDINNFYYKPISIVGFGKTKNQILVKLNKEIIINSADENNWVHNMNIDTKDTIKYVFVKPASKDTVIAIKINNWNLPFKYSPRQELEKTSNINSNYFVNNGNIIKPKYKNLKIDKNIIIPSGFILKIDEGCKIDLVKNSIFISYSPVEIDGSKDSPVLITSSDNTANGFTVLQAKTKSTLNYVTFDGLNTLNYKGWILTGGVTFYESDLEAQNVSFINNKCEDDLNIIRSNFIIDNAIFENTFSDAFDLDFSNGIISNSHFKNLGNDAIDFSGSTATIENCTIESAQDKGISGGEKSNLIVKNVTVKYSNIGIASKDKSTIRVESTAINNCKYGFVILQKKPEYGDATIDAININLENNQTEYLIEKGSKFNLNGKEIIGIEKKLAKQFYN